MRYIPDGDLVERSNCDECGIIHYQNPKILVASIIECNNKILLCKRATEPRLGHWTLPSGYMENAETIQMAAVRETHEETKVLVENTTLYAVFSCPDINQVYFVFRGKTHSDCASTTDESSESRYFSQNDVPWEDLSYSIMNKALKWYFTDHESGNYEFRMIDEYGCDPDRQD